MISITTMTYDLDGARVFQNADSTSVAETSRRISRTQTLDGGVSIYDGGHSDGDRTLEAIIKQPSQADYDFCAYILEYYALVNVSCAEGFFTAAPYSLGLDSDNNLKFTLYIKEKNNE